MSQAPAGTAHFTIFRSVREESESACAGPAGYPGLQLWEDARLQDEAIYFSRRAREELRAAVEASERKARRSHLDLAEAYECRAHLITGEVLERKRR